MRESGLQAFDELGAMLSESERMGVDADGALNVVSFLQKKMGGSSTQERKSEKSRMGRLRFGWTSPQGRVLGRKR